MVGMISPNDDKIPSTDEEILYEALERWKACDDFQGIEDERIREDIKFANGDARNGWQWPDKMYDARTDQELPCLTINKTRTHNDLIINSMSKNKYNVRIRPTSGKASYKSAEMMQTLVRRTENISRASSQYRKVAEHQVDGGIGYILIETAYISDKTFDQDIFLKAAKDPTAVKLDPYISEPDGSDANFGFISDRIPKKEFNRKYPQFKNRVGAAPFDSQFDVWLSDDEITIVKYYYKRDNPDTLIGYKDEQGNDVIKLASEIKDEAGKTLFQALMKDIDDGNVEGRYRKVKNHEVRWVIIAGNQIIEKGKWAGKYIPICRCVGREMIIQNTLDRKGHTRPLIDAQRMLNFAASTDVLMNALQPKSPWLAPARAIEGQEQWKDANVQNYAVLTYNDVDDEATDLALAKIEPPQRIAPPPVNAAYQTAMQNAERQMMMISGQYQAQMGENDIQAAASGKAIGERQEQGDTSTYHFPEHQADMLRYIGMQLIDLYPKIFDTERALLVTGEDGEKYWIHINPNMDNALDEINHIKEDGEAIKLAFNPNVGEYECVSDPGPNYATQRQEAWAAIAVILQQNEQLASTISDLLFRYGDFPGADKIAERLQKEIRATKPYLFDENSDPQLIKLQQQMEKLTALNAELMQKLALKELALKGRDEKRDIEASNAETNRMKVLVEAMAKIVLPPAEYTKMAHEIALRTHDTHLDMLADANRADIDMQTETSKQDNAPSQ